MKIIREQKNKMHEHMHHWVYILTDTQYNEFMASNRKNEMHWLYMAYSRGARPGFKWHIAASRTGPGNLALSGEQFSKLTDLLDWIFACTL